ncbi:MAG: polynucleotide adenylyltransferase PcnB [Vicinamibacteria bacterium]
MSSPAAPKVLTRDGHNVSRKNIDPDALKVLYRLKNHDFLAYLVGGGVRDLLLGRQPKDFDIGTDAHPQQVKKLFRNCFIIGRRFRLCHVRFGRKVVEVSTFRRQAEPEVGDTLIRRDNTFGTPEEDAFRRDFTVNALFYDISNFSVIDYVGGLPDLDARVIRAIGDPDVRLREDPVRMLRAVALAARLDFTIDPHTLEAIRALRGEIVKSSPARMIEEFYKILRQGRARRTFELLHETGLLPYLMPEADEDLARGGGRLLGSLARLDDYRNAGLAKPEELTNPLLAGTLLVPLGLHTRRPAPQPGRRRDAPEVEAEAPAETQESGAEALPEDVAAEIRELGEAEEAGPDAGPAPLSMPFARRDLDRIRLVLAAQRRLREVGGPIGVKRALASKGYFEDALRWLEIHGETDGRELAAHWRSLDMGDVPPPPAQAHAEHRGRPREQREHHARPGGEAGTPRSGRRRRRRRRGGGGGARGPSGGGPGSGSGEAPPGRGPQ